MRAKDYNNKDCDKDHDVPLGCSWTQLEKGLAYRVSRGSSFCIVFGRKGWVFFSPWISL